MMATFAGDRGLLGDVATAQGPVYSYNGGYPNAASRGRTATTSSDRVRTSSRNHVGNYPEAGFGTDVKVFLDDRYDQFPASVVDDFTLLNNGRSGWNDACSTSIKRQR